MGCSTRKNTSSARTYHNLTARYNVYFNAKESVKAGLERIDNTVTDDFTHILPVYKTSDPDAATVAVAEMELAIQKCSKLIALHSITRSPKRKSNTSERYKKFASKGEYNEWIDDSYLLMGEASYYLHDYHRAIENFNYVIRKFSNNPTRYEAYLGLAKTYIETGEFEKVPEILKLLERDGGMPKSLIKEVNLAYAHLFIKSGKYTEAIPFLQTALQYPMPKALKIRTYFILAQILAQNNQPEQAARLFRKVVKMRPEVDMTFNARISALELADNDTVGANKLLVKLLRDPNNEKFRDRIYFAMGQIALKGNNRDKAVEHFRTSVAYSTENNKQRAMSSLTVARILFEANDYELSSAYYDSTVAVINPEYPDYSAIISRTASLKRLADNLNTISREDSLQRLAAMPEAARNSLITNMISEIQRKEQQELAAERGELTDQNYFRAQQYRQQIRTDDNANLWYFYNPSTSGIGKTEFQRIWGKRKLEDNWRRKNKMSVISEETEQLVDETEPLNSTVVQPKVSDPKSRDYYLQDIPLTDSLMKVSNDRIKNSYFDAGRLYRSAFQNYTRSIEMLEELERRFPGSIYELSAWTELYQLYERNKDEQKMAFYKEKIIRTYPDSRYAHYLLNPNYFKEQEELRARINEKFGEAVEQYSKHNFAQAEVLATEVLKMNPDSSIIAKVRFIELTSGGSKTGNESFVHSLNQYISNFHGAPTVDLALRIRDLLKANSLADYQQLVSSGYINENIVNEELKTDKGGNDEFGGKFSYEDDMFHYYVLAFPKQAGVEVNRLMFDIANYNIDYYTSTDFDVESVNLNPKTQMVVVRSMPNKDEGLIYFKSIIRKRPVFQSLSGVDYSNFSASSANYRTILADKDYTDYLKFFMKNYSPYIGPEYPKDEIAAPSELLAKAREAEAPVEKGQFVLVQPEVVAPENYLFNNEASHTFVLTVNDSTLSLAPLVARFINYNATVHPNNNYRVTTGTVQGKQALQVSGLGNGRQALAYFREVIANRDLFLEVETTEYSNFLITETNEDVLRKKNDMKDYIAFFRQNYLNIKDESKPVEASPFDDYVGPYITKLSNENLFVLVFPTAGVPIEQLVNRFETFNSSNFGSPNIRVTAEPLDEFRTILMVSGLGEHSAAIAYFRKANSESSLYEALKGVNYRYFAISAENLEIFKRDKNLQLYQEFFNRVKW